tara:strand:+ start:69 stop:722 length:654 start_codon:yes stop_codon:yes gene_type:complete
LSTQALYDFDGTITARDTTIFLLAELIKLRPLRFLIVSWFLFRMYVSNRSPLKQRYKNQAIGCLIKGLDNIQLRPALNNYRKKVKSIYRPLVMKSIGKASKEGCKVLVVTASPSFAVSICLSDCPVQIIGTEFEKRGDIFTGSIKGESCYGEEKVNRINEWAKQKNISLDVQQAWSDDYSDYDMVNLAMNRYWIGERELEKIVIAQDPEANFIYSEH